MLFLFKSKGRADESFGDFCARVGFERLHAYAADYVPPEQVASLPQVCASVGSFKVEFKT